MKFSQKLINVVFISIIFTNLSFGQAIKVHSNGNIDLNGGDVNMQGNNITINPNDKLKLYDVRGISTDNNGLYINTYAYTNIYFDNNYGSGYEPSLRPENWCGYLGTPNNQWYKVHAYHYYANGSHIASDKRMKKNIRDFKGALNKITQMKARRYDLKSDRQLQEINKKINSLSIDNDSSVIQHKSASINSVKNKKCIDKEKVKDALKRKKQKILKNNKNHIGFVAQELKKILPEAVEYNKKADRYYVNYNMIIPLLAQAIKEQQVQINRQKNNIATGDSLLNKQKHFNKKMAKALKAQKQINKSQQQTIDSLQRQISWLYENCCANNNKNGKKSATTIPDSQTAPQAASLGQNAPNPWNEQTEISYYLPQSTNHAKLYIYNMNGRPVTNYNINQRGHGSVIIQGSELTPGMYIYTLIADENEVDTKRMILTE